jgi:hypothetical protein
LWWHSDRSANILRVEHVIEGAPQPDQQRFHIRFGTGQGRRKADGSVRERAEYDAVVVAGAEQPVGNRQSRLERRLRDLVRNQFQRAQQAARPRLADKRMVGQIGEPSLENPTELLPVGENPPSV